MIYQEMPRKGFEGCVLSENEGFYIEGKDYSDCIKQLKAWAEAHPEMWVYFHDCGIAPKKSIPVARQILEVYFFDKEPAHPLLFTRCFQKGNGGEREIDTMTEEEISKLREKQMFFFTCLLNHTKTRGKV